eukprot:818634-Amphidinium_carterae.1
MIAQFQKLEALVLDKVLRKATLQYQASHADSPPPRLCMSHSHIPFSWATAATMRVAGVNQVTSLSA